MLLAPVRPAAPFPLPGHPWTPALAEAFLAAHDRAVTAAFVRLQRALHTAHPTGRHATARYDVAGLLRAYPVRTPLDAQLLALVQVRTASGRILTATVAVEWATGSVRVTGWPDGPR